MTRLGERWEWYLFGFEGWPKKDVEKAVCLIWLPAHTKPILAASAAWHSIEDKSHTSKQTMLFLSTLKLINTNLSFKVVPPIIFGGAKIAFIYLEKNSKLPPGIEKKLFIIFLFKPVKRFMEWCGAEVKCQYSLHPLQTCH